MSAFISDSRAIGIILLACTLLSLILANLSFGALYRSFWTYSFTGNSSAPTITYLKAMPGTLQGLINDFGMAIFFFAAGMEIKRELKSGELSVFKRAILPVVAAVGGMIVPALIFYSMNKGFKSDQGWAIPMATDIAFTLGVTSILGTRIPLSLKIFLTALAIIDDLGAILVIAIFYGGQIRLIFLAAALILVLVVVLMNRFQIRFGIFQWIIGLIIWYCIYQSGIHSTISGVLFAFLVPVELLRKYELRLTIPVYFIILPLFALANTSILIPAHFTELMHNKISWGIITGLCVGKPAGICMICLLVITMGWAELPQHVNWTQMIGAGILAGIGFTMSIFIASLSYEHSAWKDIAILSILIASVISMVTGYWWLRIFSHKKKPSL